MTWRLFIAKIAPETRNFDFKQIFERATNIFEPSYQGFCHVSINHDKILVIVWITTKCPHLIKFDIVTQTLSLDTKDTNIKNSIDFYLNTHKRDEILKQYELELPSCPENNFLLLKNTKYTTKARNYHPLLEAINNPKFTDRIKTCFEKINVYVVDITNTNTDINITLSHKYIENTFYMYMLIDGTIEIRKNISSALSKTPYLIFNYVEENKYDNLHVDIALNSPPSALNSYSHLLNSSPSVLNSSPLLNSSPSALNSSPLLNSPPEYEVLSQSLIPRIKRARMSPDTFEPTDIPLPGTRAVKVQNFSLNLNDACTQTDIIGERHIVQPVRKISPEVLSELSSSLAILSSFINSLQN